MKTWTRDKLTEIPTKFKKMIDRFSKTDYINRYHTICKQMDAYTLEKNTSPYCWGAYEKLSVERNNLMLFFKEKYGESITQK